MEQQKALSPLIRFASMYDEQHRHCTSLLVHLVDHAPVTHAVAVAAFKLAAKTADIRSRQGVVAKLFETSLEPGSKLLVRRVEATVRIPCQ